MKSEDSNQKKGATKKPTDRQILELQIDHKLAEAVRTLRESNKAELESIASEKHEPRIKRLQKWLAWTISISILSNLVAWLGVPQRVKDEANRVINEKLIEPQLTNTLDNALSNRAVPFIVGRLRPVETNVSIIAAKADSLNRTIEVLSLDISRKQTELTSQQIAITNQQHLLALIVGAKGGSMADYLELRALSRQTNSFHSLAEASTIEVELFFDAYRHRTYASRIFMDAISSKLVEMPVDSALHSLQSVSTWSREAAAQLLARVAKANTVAHICDAIQVETNLFTLSMMTKALGAATGEGFEALNCEAVAAWWSRHNTEARFQTPYRDALRYGNVLMLSPVEAQNAIEVVSKTIQKEPEAWAARSLRAHCNAVLGNLELAEKEIAEIEKGFPNYAGLHLVKAFVNLTRDKVDAFVNSLNKAFELQPSLEIQVRGFWSGPLLGDPRIRWPSTSTNSASIK